MLDTVFAKITNDERGSMSQEVALIDDTGAVVGVAQVDQERELFSGSVDLRAMPADMLRKFEEFEEIVNDQTFSLVDQVQQEIERLGLKAVFGNGRQEAIDDLQIYPTDGVLSFQLKTPVALAVDPTNGNGQARNQ